jgi:hypothetical protein
MEYQVVIPSYKRAKTIKDKTLRVLHLQNIPRNRIHIFVASESEKAEYESENPGYKVILGVLGLVQQRNFIQSYFPVGTLLLSLDDDVESVSILEGEKLRPLSGLENIIHLGFSECLKNKARLWSIYPVHNAFFMKHKITTDFKFCIGSFFGFINPGTEILNPSSDGCKEDYLRTILFWKADKSIVRINYVAHKTNYGGGTGGLQESSLDSRVKKEVDAVLYLLTNYPDLVRLNPKRKSPFPEILLKRAK